MRYTHQHYAAVAVMIAIVVLGAIQVAGGDALGLSGRAMAWLGVATAGLGVLQATLPKVQKPPDDERRGMD